MTNPAIKPILTRNSIFVPSIDRSLSLSLSAVSRPRAHTGFTRFPIKYVSRNEVSVTVKATGVIGGETGDGYPIGISKVKELSRHKLGYRGPRAYRENPISNSLFFSPTTRLFIPDNSATLYPLSEPGIFESSQLRQPVL